MKALFIGGTGTISTAISMLAVKKRLGAVSIKPW
jgi:hypothetical protein